MKEPSERRQAGAEGRAKQRRQYKKPKLTEYGSIAKLTQGTRTKITDGPSGGFVRTSCF